jgi:hypothetical protein
MTIEAGGMTPEQAISALDKRGFFHGSAECGCTKESECDRCFALSILKTIYFYRGTADNEGQYVVCLREEWREYRSLKRKKRVKSGGSSKGAK